MHAWIECWILNSAKLEQYYYFHAEFLEEVKLNYRGNYLPDHSMGWNDFTGHWLYSEEQNIRAALYKQKIIYYNLYAHVHIGNKIDF